MAPVINGRLLFNEVPTGYPEPGRTTIYDVSETIDPDTVVLRPGSILVKVLLLSIEPYLRFLLAGTFDGVHTTFKFGKPLSSRGIGIVVRSENPSFEVGDHVIGQLEFSQYFVKEDATTHPGTGLIILKNERGLPWSAYLGILGLPGLTGYLGWTKFAQAKKGQTAFISTGAGGVGSMVVQLAKRDGLKVIASAGSDEKVKFMKDIGVDVAFNYKTTSTEAVLAKEGPIHVYWDNVGGETLDIAIKHAALDARFLECGMISEYNTDKRHAFQNLKEIILRRINIIGVLVEFYAVDPPSLQDFFNTVSFLVASGALKYIEDRTVGLEKAGHALAKLYHGENTGKSIVVVSEEDGL